MQAREQLPLFAHMLKPLKNRVKLFVNPSNAVCILLGLFIFLNSLTYAQDKVLVVDSVSTSSIADSTRTTIPLSKDRLESAVSYESKDSIVYDARVKKLYLHDHAIIKYEDIEIQSDYIMYEQDSSRLMAYKIDSLHKIEDSLSHPSKLSQGTESSTFSTLQYNFKSKRALVENAYSQYGEGFILSNQVKRNNDQTINGYKNIYTTCSDPHPHFGIGARRIKIIPNKVAVSGSANLIIEDIPTPLFLPFGLFPLKKGQRSGFILPTYSVTQNLGFGLLNGGYYFALNEHYDLQLNADLYTLGSWRVSAASGYNYKYRFNGGLRMEFTYNKVGETYEPGNLNSRDFAITWRHTIDPKVLQNSSFNANVNVRSSRFNTLNSFDANAHLQNSMNSNITYSKSWVGKPFNFTAALRHSQNTLTRLYDITLPELNFNVNQIFPFHFRKNIIKPRWYEQISASYNVRAVNTLQFSDSDFSISNLRWNDFNNGIEHAASVGATYKILKYINFSTNADYQEYWYTKRFFQQYNFEENRFNRDTMTGFYTARSWRMRSSFSTLIYGTKIFKKGVIRGIRHVFNPSIGFGYHPDFGRQYYYETFINQNYDRSRISYYSGSIIGTPQDGREGSISFNFGNTLQMKVRDRKDTVNGFRKLNLIDGLNFGATYNMAADSLRWSNPGINYRTTLIPNVQLNGGASFSLYGIDTATGRTINRFYKNTNGKWMRFTDASISLATSLPLKKKNTLAQTTETQRAAIGNNYGAYADFNIPWSLNINYSLRINQRYLTLRDKDTVEFNHDLLFNGDVNLTSKWKIGFTSGFDFREKNLKYSTFDIYRDLHCWEMRLSLIPFGLLKSYNFTLAVKSSVLQDLKLVRRKDYRDFL